MNREDTKKAIEVMQAYVDGKEIKTIVRFGYVGQQPSQKEPDWNFSCFKYRVKLKPKEFWVHKNEAFEQHPGVRGLGPGPNYIRVREVLDD